MATKKLAKVGLELFYNYLLHNYCLFICLVKFQFGEFSFVLGESFSCYNPQCTILWVVIMSRFYILFYGIFYFVHLNRMKLIYKKVKNNNLWGEYKSKCIFIWF
jgi:Trk-type K+ transport system membrane component